MPKLRIKIKQYVWCWVVILLIFNTPTASTLNITGYFIYLYAGSVSLVAIRLFLQLGGVNKLVLVLCLIETLAILLQIPTAYANLVSESNYFHQNYRAMTRGLFDLEVLLLTTTGIYGFGLLFYRRYRDKSDNDNVSFKAPHRPLVDR